MPANAYKVQPCPACRWYDAYTAAQRDSDEWMAEAMRLREQNTVLREQNARLKRQLQLYTVAGAA